MDTPDELEAELRALWPRWIWCAGAPLVPLLVVSGSEGIRLSLGILLLGTATLGATPFLSGMRAIPGVRLSTSWRRKLGTAALAEGAAFFVFTAAQLGLRDRNDRAAVLLAGLALIPSLTIAPYFALVCRRLLPAVVFTAGVVFGMKLVAAIVVVLVHGWDASEHGLMTMPWLAPNLLVRTFWAASAAVCVACAWAARRRFSAGAAPRPA